MDDRSNSAYTVASPHTDWPADIPSLSIQAGERGPPTMPTQPELPQAYRQLSDPEIAARIAARKVEIGKKMLILGHHYQGDDIIIHADLTGDSLKLAQLAAKQADAQYILFCGVHFMAESADILTSDHVTVILPELSAGCPMADMASADQLDQLWPSLTAQAEATIIPVTYVNSTAEVKAFCGRHGGACCTSGNAPAVLKWALAAGDKVLFLPDQHLGRNTAYALGIPLEAMALLDPDQPAGGLSRRRLRDAAILLWPGYCHVHQIFTVAQCHAVRQRLPGVRIVVHPEAPWDVVQAADLAGSTEYIIKVVEESHAEIGRASWRERV